MATNRIETLDPALLRPGRIDRKIEFPLPDAKTKRRIFNIHVSRMSLADDVNLEEFVMSKDQLSGADIKAMCTEAGLLALRERRMKARRALRAVHEMCRARVDTCGARAAQITHTDFKKAKDKVCAALRMLCALLVQACC
jgi:ATP-dependent 26S proteasome regulatory subunit